MEIRISHHSVECPNIPIYAATIFPKVAVWLFEGMSLSPMHFGMLPWMRKGNDATSCLPLDGCFVFRLLYETGWSTSEEGLAMYFWSTNENEWLQPGYLSHTTSDTFVRLVDATKTIFWLCANHGFDKRLWRRRCSWR
jgi:hypothetical protein